MTKYESIKLLESIQKACQIAIKALEKEERFVEGAEIKGVKNPKNGNHFFLDTKTNMIYSPYKEADFLDALGNKVTLKQK